MSRWRPWRRVRSMRWRLLILLALALLGTALVVGGLTWRSVRAETEAIFDYQLRQTALTLRNQGGFDARQSEALNDPQLDFVVQIWTLDGALVYSSRAAPVLPERVVLGLADVSAGGEVWRSYALIGRGRVIQVAQPARVRQALATAAALRSVVPIGWLALPLGLLLWGVVERGLRPLRQLAGGVRQRDAHSLAPFASDGVPEELMPLVDALNGLLARLEQALSAQRAFVADAAHELRSPLTALKLQWQLLGRVPDAAARAEAVAALGEGIERTARLVEQLLALARSEPGGPSGAVDGVDLAEIARGALVDTLPQAQLRGTELVLEADAPAWLHADATALGALVRNLADNAVRYSPPGSQVRLRVAPASAGQGVRLWVEDSGPGIPPAERGRIFDRFYRGSTSHDSAGSGLGLAIVRAVAQRHGAEVSLEDSALGGLGVRVDFPPPPPSGAGA